jgi:polysaccharide biosynthesis/export protein
MKIVTTKLAGNFSGFVDCLRLRLHWNFPTAREIRRAAWTVPGSAVGVFCLLWVSTAFAQQVGIQPAEISASELAKDNLDRVGASESQITAVLNANPGLFVELKRWIAKDAAGRGQIIRDSDLTDAAVLSRLANDVRFRGAATRLLQGYGYLLPKINPDSEVGRQQAALEQERIRELVAAQQAQAQQPQQNQLAKCSPSSADSDCPTKPKTPGKTIVQTGTANPTELPRDRDFGQLLANPVSAAPTGNGSLLKTSVIPFEGTSSGASGVSESDLTLMPVSYDRMALPDPDPPPQPTPLVAAPSSAKTASAGAGPMLDVNMLPVESHWSPYSDILSIYDIFSHSASASGSVARFGEEVFQNPTPASGTIPIDFPASPDYVVGPGDGLTIDLWGGVSQRLVRTVDHEGRIALPEIGPVLVNGQTLSDLQQSVQQLLRTQFRDVSADVSLSRLRTVRVYVVGDVNHPGPYDVSSLSTPLNALLAAGGPTANGSMRIVRHYRGNTLVQQVDLYDPLLRGVRTDIQRLEPGDTLLVPAVGALVQMDGMVRRPAVYELRGETTLAQAIDMAGGILPTAALSHIEVQRLEAHEKRTMLSLDVSATPDAGEIETKITAFRVQDRDEVHIFPIATFNQDAVYLQGHVFRAGRYAYKPGMRLTDLVASYSDLMPEPSTKYAEIIHLNPPDYHPNVESFDLALALSNPAAAPSLKPLDTVRIFSRFDFEDAPAVSVSGAVRNPGTFQTSGQIRVRDAIGLAGGVTPDAALDSAQIIRILADSSLKMVSVRLGDALAGDPTSNILLEPRDRVLIQQNPFHVDTPTVFIAGEVVNPGRYPLTASLRISDLIQLAGGFKRSAYLETADLTRFDPQAGENKLGEHIEVKISPALSTDAGKNPTLRDGDVLTIRQLSGWNDIGASVSLQGEVEHPGTYGIRPGERLSSVLKRAGGFAPQAYVYGAVFSRPEVQTIEEQSRAELIQRIRGEQAELAPMPGDDADKRAAKQNGIQQLDAMLGRLQERPSTGRMVVRISSNLRQWENGANDPVVHSGDALLVPKVPNFILVYGAVYNQTAITYKSGRSANWYLAQAGGPSQLADKKAIFIVRADGSIVGGQSSDGWFSGNPLAASLHPGDMVVVPEKAAGQNQKWKTLVQTATTISSIGTSAAIAAKF